MSLRKNMTVAVIAIVSVTFGAASTLGAQELLHGLSAYDSGWVDFPPGYEVVLAHLVGGDPDDYVVDLQVRDLVDGHGGGHRVHQLGFGGDELNGVYWERLTSSGITVRGWDSEGRIDQFRVRIWVVSDVDYDSGWVGFDAGQDTKWLTHDLGGAVSDYVVDLQFVDFGGKGIHTFGYGRNLMYQVGTWGAAWFRLDLSQVAVHGTNDAYVDNFRLRIFRRPDPAYDSGWVSMTGATYFLPHQLGGPWNDYVVDLQLRDLNDNLGVNQVGYGGDVWDDGAKAIVEAHGAYWSHLSGRSITVSATPTTWRRTRSGCGSGRAAAPSGTAAGWTPPRAPPTRYPTTWGVTPTPSWSTYSSTAPMVAGLAPISTATAQTWSLTAAAMSTRITARGGTTSPPTRSRSSATRTMSWSTRSVYASGSRRSPSTTWAGSTPRD